MYIIANSAELNTTDLHDLNWSLSALSVENLLTGLKETVQNSNENVVPVKKQNVRQELMRQLYDLYLEACNKEYYVKNKKRYYAFVRNSHPEALKDAKRYNSYKDIFRRSKLSDERKYLSPIDSKDYLWWGRFSHLKGEEGNECLRTILSNAKEMKSFGRDITSYILGAAGKLSHEK